MGPSKNANRKQTEISLIKIKAFEAPFQTTEDVSTNKRRMQDDRLERQPVKENLASALETVENAEVSVRKKKKKERKSDRSNTLEKTYLDQNLVEASLEKSKGKSFSTSLQNTETISEITNKPNPEFGVNGNHGTSLQTADNTVEGNAMGKRIKSKKKRRNESQNNDPDENLLVTRTLGGPEVTNIKHLGKENSFSEISELNPSTFSKSDANSMTKNDLSTEINLVSVEKSSLLTYQRKKKKLSHSQGKQLLLSKEEAPGSSLQDKKNSSKEEVSVTYSNYMLTQMESKGRSKSETVNCEGNLIVAEKVSREIGSFGEKNLKAFPSNNKLGKVKEAKSVSCRVLQNISMEGVSVNCSDKELAPGKRKVKKVKKSSQTISGDEVPKNGSRSDVFDQHLVDENGSELSKVHITLEEHRFSVEENIEESKNLCKEDRSLASVETGDIKHGHFDSVELCNKGCSTSSRAVENVAIGESSINRSKKRTTSRRSRKMEVKHTLDDRKASDTPPFHHTPQQPEHLEQVHNVSNEENLIENVEQEIVPSPSTENVIRAGLLNKKDKPLEFLSGEGNSTLLPAVVDPHPKQPENLEAHYAFSEDNPKVKASYISGEEIPEVSLSEHEKEEMIPLSSSKSDIKDGLIDEGDNPLGMLTEKGCSSLLPAVEDVSLVKSSANNLGPVTSKRKKDKKKKMLPGEGNSSLLPAVEDPHPKQPEDLEGHYAFGEDYPKVKLSNISSEEIPEVSLSEHKKEEMISLSSRKCDIKGDLIDKGDAPLGILTKEGCSSLLPAVEDISLGKDSANNFVPASSRTRRRKKRKDVKHTANEDKASENTSVCDPPAEQLEPRDECCVLGEENLVLEESLPLDGKNLKVEAFHVSGEENLDISSNTCQMEEKTSPNGDVIEDAVIAGVMNKEDNHLNMFPASPVRAPISCTRRKLLVLDLNGLLADIVSDVPEGYKAHKQIARKALFKRPFCEDFLKFCFENFNVGVWSSRTKKNVNSVVDFLMGDTKKNLLFCWDQSHCTETGVGTLENRQKPLVLKELKKLWDKREHSLPWEKGTYNESNTLLLDDSPYKALRNPLHTAIFPPPYRFQDTNDHSLGPGGDLRVYLEGLVMAENVQEYVKQHPFGQRAITNKNPSWGFYVRIIGANNVPTEANINSSSTHLQMGSTG